MRDDRRMTLSVPGWRYVQHGFEGADVVVGGVNPWRYEWQSQGDPIEVPHPSYPSQRHRLEVWRVATANGSVTFAAGELSNGVWCFYQPDPGR
jgi:hypothetical protein